MVVQGVVLGAHLLLVFEKFFENKIEFSLNKYCESFCSIVSAQFQNAMDDTWIFQRSEYGNLCGAAKVVRVRKDAIPRVLKSGPYVLNNNDCLDAASDGDFQLVLMNLWAEVGHGRVFLSRLRDQLKPNHESIIYFRIKNGKRIAKMITRDDATTFMRSSKAVRNDDGLAFLQTAAARDFYLPTYNTQMAFAQRVGELALLMVHAPIAAVSPFKPVLERIQTCAKLEQHKLYSSVNNTPTGDAPTGLVTWAWLTSKHLRSEAFDTNALQAFEWSEGSHLAVVDMVLSPDTEAAVWADLAGLLYPEEDIWLLCQVGERVFFKKWVKHQRKELLTNPRARSAIAFGTWHDITQEPTCPL